MNHSHRTAPRDQGSAQGLVICPGHTPPLAKALGNQALQAARDTLFAHDVAHHIRQASQCAIGRVIGPR
jgi:hypothetical protein